MRIASFNINDIRRRLPLLLAWLDVTRPDVVALQELKATEAEFPHEEIRQAGYESLVVGEKTWNGVALLARGAAPLQIRRALPGNPQDRQARYLEAAVQGLVVAALYLPNGNPQPGPKFDYKLAWFERLLVHARELKKTGHPVVLAGDFNVVPKDVDIYDPAHWQDNALLHPEVRAAYARLLRQGWTDALRATHPRRRIYTFWSYMRKRWPRDAGLRIDHLLLSPSLRPLLVGAGVDRELRGFENASDHAPVWVAFG